MHGAAGRILHVDLSHEQLHVEQPEPSFYRTYGGGSALGSYYLLKHTPPKADPLAPENTLVFALSPLTGAPLAGLSRMTTTAKSPLTQAIGDAQCGGFFPAEMKFAGFDAIVVHGRAERPLYLWLHDAQAELRPAQAYWGKATGEVDLAIKQELSDSKIQIAQCGPAGEKLVRFANIINMANRANGRTGMGAVMGSKNLKAIAVRGHQKPSIAHPAKLKALQRWGIDHFEQSGVYGLSIYGTARGVSGQQAVGGLPTRNWQSGVFEGWETLDGEAMKAQILKSHDTCFACHIRCKPVVEAHGRYEIDPQYGGPEYETLAMLGSLCGVDSLEAVAYANQLCNMHGLDTISCGGTIAWAMECFEKGLITSADTGGLELRFGNQEALVEMVEQIAQRRGFGDLLAEGSAAAASRFGPEAEALLVTSRGQEFPAHMPQVKRSLALIYAVNPFGADHLSHEHDPLYRQYPERMAELGLTDPQPDQVLNQEKVRFALLTQYHYSCLDTLDLCAFVHGPSSQLYGPLQIVELVHAITGWDVDLDELQRLGERRLNLMRLFNAREGFTREHDCLPPKVEQALLGGPSDGLRISRADVERAKDLYFAMAGWDVRSGLPTSQKLEELGLDWAVALLPASL